jgi:cardiolipin synthase
VHPDSISGGGSAGRAAAGAIRIRNTIGAAFINRRIFEPAEARIAIFAGLLLLAIAILSGFFPRLLAYPLAVVLLWFAAALLLRGYKLTRQDRRD